MSTNVLVNQSEKLRSMDGWYIQKARVESSQSSFAFESVIKVSFLLPKFLGLVKNETNKTIKHLVQDREQLKNSEKATNM